MSAPDWSTSLVLARQALHRAEQAILQKDLLGAVAQGANALDATNGFLLWVADEMERVGVA